MKPIVADVLVDLILEDVLSDGSLFEMNPYHDQAGKFTSKGATELYQSGALAFGRAKGLKAKAQGVDREGIRSAIKAGIEQHLAGKGDREAGQDRLTLIRGKMAKGTIGAAPKPKAEKVREPRAPKEKELSGNLQTFMTLVKKQHGEAMQRADDAVRRINAKEGDQIQARKDWNQAHAEMAELRGKIETVRKKLQERSKPAGAKADAVATHAPLKPDNQTMSNDALKAKLTDLTGQHEAAAEEHHKAQEGIRGQATRSDAGVHYRAMATATERMAALKGQMAHVQTELQRRGAAQ